MALKLLFRFGLASRFTLLSLSLPFLFTGLRLSLFSFELDWELLFSCFTSLVLFVFELGDSVIDVSPSLAGRLISTATVWPTLTISPARGSWIKTVSGFA